MTTVIFEIGDVVRFGESTDDIREGVELLPRRLAAVEVPVRQYIDQGQAGCPIARRLSIVLTGEYRTQRRTRRDGRWIQGVSDAYEEIEAGNGPFDVELGETDEVVGESRSVKTRTSTSGGSPRGSRRRRWTSKTGSRDPKPSGSRITIPGKDGRTVRRERGIDIGVGFLSAPA